MRAGIEPSIASTHNLHAQLPALEISVVDSCDLQFPPLTRLDGLGNIDHLVVIKIEARYSEVAFWRFGLFLDRKSVV